jgi:hypothetical protein
MLASPVAFTTVMRAVLTPRCTSQANLLSAAIERFKIETDAINNAWGDDVIISSQPVFFVNVISRLFSPRLVPEVMASSSHPSPSHLFSARLMPKALWAWAKYCDKHYIQT